MVAERVRAAEVIAALCLATDLGIGLPFEHGLHKHLVAMRLADRLGVDRENRVADVLRVPAFRFGLHRGRATSRRRSSAIR